jgi:hypothetical protein
MEGASARWLGGNQTVGYTSLFRRVKKAGIGILRTRYVPSESCALRANHGNPEMVPR